jgi:hypothetical protein
MAALGVVPDIATMSFCPTSWAAVVAAGVVVARAVAVDVVVEDVPALVDGAVTIDAARRAGTRICLTFDLARLS